MSSQMLFGGLGEPELILIASIALLLAVSNRLFPRPVRHDGAAVAASRAYLDRLLGTARRASRPMSPQKRRPSSGRASPLEIGVS